ncbi:MAG: prepilin-type N-terminal cleavage/methylation domain-containing protein [Patescibacteria group bacterium]
MTQFSSFKFQVSRSKLQDRGFTLVELIVVVFIVAILSTLTFANFRTGERANALIAQTEKIAGLYRQAQAKALSGELIGAIRPDAYGVYIGASQIKLFAENHSSDPHFYCYDSGSDTLVQSIDIPSYLTITPADSTDLSIVYTPSQGYVYRSLTSNVTGTALTTSQDVSIYNNQETILSKIIRLRSTGQIDIIR